MKEDFDLILEHACSYMGVTVGEAISSSRKTDIVKARAIAIYWIKSLHRDCPWKSIGRWLSMDHSSVITAYDKMDSDIYGLKACIMELNPLDYQRFNIMNLTYDINPRYRLVK